MVLICDQDTMKLPPIAKLVDVDEPLVPLFPLPRGRDRTNRRLGG